MRGSLTPRLLAPGGPLALQKLTSFTENDTVKSVEAAPWTRCWRICIIVQSERLEGIDEFEGQYYPS